MRRPDPKAWFVLCLCALGAAWFFWPKAGSLVAPAGPRPVTTAVSLYEPDDKPATVFLRGMVTNSGEVQTVPGVIRQSKSRLNQMKQAVLLYLEGPGGLKSMAPRGCVINQIYLTAAGTAVVDLSVAPDDAFGFYDEAVFAGGINHALAQNFKEVKRVRLLNDGIESGTLAGHYALGTAESLSVPAAQAALPSMP